MRSGWTPRRASGRAVVAALGAALLLPPAALAAQDEPSWGLSGSIAERAWAAWAGADEIDPDEGVFGSATGIELALRADGGAPRGGGSRASARATFDASLRAGAAQAGGEELSARFRELGLGLDLGFASIEAGRVIINWSLGKPWSPVDLFASYDASGPEPLRIGADALVLRAPIGATGLVEAAAAPGSAGLDSGRYALRASGYALGADAGLVGAWDGDSGDWIAGADLKTDLGIGLHAEGICAMARGRDARFRVAAGADWSLRLGEDSGRLLAQAEYCYDEMPLPSPRGAPDTHNAYAALSWAGYRASLSAGVSHSMPGETLSASLLVSFDAAPGSALIVYARASRGPSGSAVETGLSLGLSF